MTAVEETRRACGGEPERPDSLRAFGEVLRSFRKRAGFTQEELAELLQYSAQTLTSASPR